MEKSKNIVLRWKSIGIVLFLFILLTAYEYLGIVGSVEASSNKVKIGYVPNYGTLFNEQDEQRMGYGYDYFMEIAKYIDIEYEFIPCTWSEGLELLENGEIDLFGPMLRTEERERIYSFSDWNFGYEYGTLYAPQASEIYYEDFEAFNGMKIGTEENNSYNTFLVEYFAERGIDLEFVYTDGIAVSQEFEQQQYDMFLSGSLYDLPDVKVVAKFATFPFYYGITQKNEQLLADINYAMEEINKNNVYFSAMLNKKYFGDRPISKPSFTREELELIQRNPILIVGCDEDTVPVQYFDNEWQEFTGVSIDILKALSEEVGVKFQFVSLEEYQGEVDLIASYRKGHIFENTGRTDAYYRMPLVFVGQQKTRMDQELVVGMPVLDDVSLHEVEKKYPHFNIREYEVIDELITALKKKEIDLALMSLYMYNDVCKDGTYNQYLTIPANIEIALDIGLTSQLPPQFLEIINKGIERMGSEYINTLVFGSTISKNANISFSDAVKASSYEIMIISSIIAVILVGLIIAIIRVNYSKQMLIKQNTAELERVAYVDDVTGVATLAKFKLEVQQRLQQAGSNDYTIIALDIENFKYINSSYGYSIGDEVLRYIARYYRVDAERYVFVSRIDADRFLFLSKDNEELILENYKKYKGHLSRRLSELLGEAYTAKFNVGVYRIENPQKDIAQMIDCAIYANKLAKSQYGNGIVVYNEGIDVALNRQKVITLTMEKALEAGEFTLYLQPKYSLDDYRIVGAEGLVRWEPKNGSMIYPSEFIPLFEKNGFIEVLDLYMLDEVYKIKHRLHQVSPKNNIKISVNLSKNTLIKEHLIEQIQEIGRKYDVEPTLIEFEITESVLGENIEQVIKRIDQLRALRYLVSIDDFGSGYSALNLLSDVRVDTIKLDKEFLSNNTEYDRKKIILENIIQMGKQLGLEIVAEGIEKEIHAIDLKAMNCDIGQGYFFSKPVPAKVFLDMIDINKK